MSYEELNKSIYGNDVFTNGVEGRYTKPKETLETSGKTTSEKKKRAPKIPPVSTTDDQIEQLPYENGHTDEPNKTKKKNRKNHENDGTQNEEETSLVTSIADGETVVKPKKKRAPKIESNNENIDPVPTTEEGRTKKKKSKTPKSTPIDEEFEIIENPITNELEPSTEIPTKVKKSKKSKKPKTTIDPTSDAFYDVETNTNYELSTNPEFDGVYTGEGAYGSTVGDVSYDTSAPYTTETEQIFNEPEKSEQELAIINAYNNLGSKINFGEYVGNDQWCIIHLPKSARGEPKSRIRKILPGGKDEKSTGKFPGGKTTYQKGGFFNRIRTGVGSLVRDENNLLFGEQSNYELAMYDDDDEDDIDTDDLHRYAQKLRELEDTDREVNPEFLVLRDGKTVYAVHEADAEGKLTYTTRKPIYDRYNDQAPDDEPTEKKKLLSRLKNPFNRNKDKDGKGSNSPKSAHGTPDPSGKRRTRKSNNKTTDDDMATMANSEPLVD